MPPKCSPFIWFSFTDYFQAVLCYLAQIQELLMLQAVLVKLVVRMGKISNSLGWQKVATAALCSSGSVPKPFSGSRSSSSGGLLSSAVFLSTVHLFPIPSEPRHTPRFWESIIYSPLQYICLMKVTNFNSPGFSLLPLVAYHFWFIFIFISHSVLKRCERNVCSHK